MQPKSIYPVIGTKKVSQTADFYVRHFGFTVTFESDWYVSMRHGKSPQFELALLDYTHPSVPEVGKQPVAGLLINFEVDDVDAVYERLINDDRLPVLLDIRSEPWGQRHFITSDPNDVLIDVITNIPPEEEFLTQYAAQDQ
jgi:catechol 2,3-dioxygenase-like lactoylglutathione lyase family enzyme